jgi:hypothetical protein
MEKKLNAEQQKIFNSYITEKKGSYIIKEEQDINIYFFDYELLEDNEVVLTIKCQHVVIKMWKKIKHILIIIL